MGQFFKDLPIWLIILPPIISWMIYFLPAHKGQNQWRRIHRTVQFSACFYIAAVSCLLRILFGHYYIALILIVLISFLGIILIVQWRKKTEVVLRKGLKTLWRISFLLFFPLYAGLLIYWSVIFILKQIG